MIKNSTAILFFIVFLYCPSQIVAQQTWDWHIMNGEIVDGTGAKAYKADMLIRGDSIGFIGQVDADTITAKRTIDASGKIVSPSFIDVHAHGSPMGTPLFQNFLAMGVTTIVLGQDGSSVTSGSLLKWFNEVEAANPAVNIAVLSGHGTLRRRAGVGKQPANEQELNQMESLLKEDLQAGAFGMSTGLEYVPGLYAEEDELIRLAGVVGKQDGVIMSHMRSEDDSQIEKSLQELATQGEKARVHVSHLKVVYGEGTNRAADIINLIETYNQQGISLTADTYPYAASYTGIGIVFPKWAKTNAERQQAMNERPTVLHRFLEQKLEKRNGPDAILFGSGPYAGKTLHEAAQQEDTKPVDLLLKMGPQAASAAHFVMNEELQDYIATAPGVMISSDGSPTMHHPRGYGSFAKVIHRYVQQQQTLTIEEAVHKMSGFPAKTLQLPNHGTLEIGNKADILVFDLDSIRHRATFSQPHKLAQGFNWIWVNGTLIQSESEFTGDRPGEALKRGTGLKEH